MARLVQVYATNVAKDGECNSDMDTDDGYGRFAALYLSGSSSSKPGVLCDPNADKDAMCGTSVGSSVACGGHLYQAFSPQSCIAVSDHRKPFTMSPQMVRCIRSDILETQSTVLGSMLNCTTVSGPSDSVYINGFNPVDVGIFMDAIEMIANPTFGNKRMEHLTDLSFMHRVLPLTDFFQTVKLQEAIFGSLVIYLPSTCTDFVIHKIVTFEKFVKEDPDKPLQWPKSVIQTMADGLCRDKSTGSIEVTDNMLANMHRSTVVRVLGHVLQHRVRIHQ